MIRDKGSMPAGLVAAAQAKCTYCDRIVHTGSKQCATFESFPRQKGPGRIEIQRRVVCADCMIRLVDLVLTKPKVKPSR